MKRLSIGHSSKYGPQSLKNHPAVFKKENRASLKYNFMSHDYNKRLLMKTINSSSQRSKH